MAGIEWRHNRERLLLPVVALPGYNSSNPTENIRVEGLLDTGATGTGIREDIARHLALRPKGQRRVYTANGMILASEYLIRIGLICGDHSHPDFTADTQQPYVIEREILAFGLQAGFGYPMLIGMDILGDGDLSIRRDGRARFDFE